jgi:hypothetical protein
MELIILPGFPHQRDVASKTCPPVLTLHRPDPGMHNKVKNQRIWLMPLSFDLFKYFSDKK